MYQIDHYLMLNRPGAVQTGDEAMKLPMAPEDVRAALERSLSAGSQPVFGAVVPVVYRGEPDPGLVAAIYWATGMGRFEPLEQFELRDAADIEAAVETVLAVQAENGLGEPLPMYVSPAPGTR